MWFNGTLRNATYSRQMEKIKATFLELREADLEDEGLYVCSVLSYLNDHSIKDAYASRTAPIYTYVMIYYDQRPPISRILVKSVTEVYVRFMVQVLFHFLYQQKMHCDPVERTTQELLRILKEHDRRLQPMRWFHIFHLIVSLSIFFCFVFQMLVWILVTVREGRVIDAVLELTQLAVR